jgi:LEA14-like dessication related protein
MLEPRMKDAHASSIPPGRRLLLRAAVALACGATLATTGCASFPGREPVRVSLAGIEALPGQGLELRLAVKLRVLNPNDNPIEYDGAFVDLSLQGSDLASGVSGEKGMIPRFGEGLITIPVTIGALAAARQVFSLATGNAERTRMAYKLRGGLAGGMLGGIRFTDQGEADLSSLAQRALGGSGTGSGGAGSPPAPAPSR